ncbi:MAG: four helix bundle protein [Patescibacteria group bacterium]
MHKIGELYKTLYLLGKKIPKRDHFGIHLKIEQLCLDILELSISAALEIKEKKSFLLSNARIKNEVLKRLLRNARELSIIHERQYINIEKELIEISKMINGWLKFLNNKEGA